MKQPDFVVKVEFPALDRFCALVEAGEQTKIDELTQTVAGIRAKVKEQTSRLQAGIDETAR